MPLAPCPVKHDLSPASAERPSAARWPGGIFTAADAWEKITAGASLVQLYTGFVYEGPGLVRDIKQALVREMT